MNLKKILLTGATLLLAAPMFASTYFGGYEDLSKNSDWDYNDIVFSLSGSGLSLHTSDGAFYSKPVLGTSGDPFWNHASYDGANYNVGYCMYGGGNCNKGVGLNPEGSYLADKTNTAKAANHVYFTVDGSVGADIFLKIAGMNDVLGWYDFNGHYGIINGGGASGTFAFHPTTAFELFGTNITGYNNGNPQYGNVYYSLNCDPNEPSHFAFFATPEPGTMSIMGLGLVAVGTLFRRRKSAATEARH
jgi:hypothetical protein